MESEDEKIGGLKEDASDSELNSSLKKRLRTKLEQKKLWLRRNLILENKINTND